MTKWYREPERLEELLPFAEDKAFREKFDQVKQFNKHQLQPYAVHAAGYGGGRELYVRFAVPSACTSISARC